MAVMNRVAVTIVYDNKNLGIDAETAKNFLISAIEEGIKSDKIPSPFTGGNVVCDQYTVGDSAEETPILTKDQLLAK